MTSVSHNQPAIIRTERGLTISGTRITLYDVMDYVTAQYPPKFIRSLFVPIVRRTGGLVDTVEPHDPENHSGTGYGFDRYEPLDVYTALARSWEGFQYKDRWQELQQRGMRQDFSWDRSAKQYHQLYRDALGLSPEDPDPVDHPALVFPTEP